MNSINFPKKMLFVQFWLIRCNLSEGVVNSTCNIQLVFCLNFKLYIEIEIDMNIVALSSSFEGFH